MMMDVLPVPNINSAIEYLDIPHSLMQRSHITSPTSKVHRMFSGRGVCFGTKLKVAIHSGKVLQYHSVV